MISCSSPTARSASRYSGVASSAAIVSGAASSVAPASNSGTIRSRASPPPARARLLSFISSSTSSRSAAVSVPETM